MLRYTLRQLEYVLAVIDHGSVARAAAALGVSQPTISAAVMKLEDQLGLQLLIRHHAQGMSTAPQGARIVAEARSLLSQAQDLQRQAGGAKTAVAGDLTIGAFLTLAPAFMPRLIAEFQARHPQARLLLKEGTQTELVEGLRLGRFDLALLYMVDLPPGLRLTELARFDPYVLLPPKHRLARHKKVSLSHLAQEPLILLDIPPSRSYFTGLLEAKGIAPRIAFSSPSLELVRGLVGQGLGLSILVTRPHGDRSYDGQKLIVRPILEETQKGEVALAALSSTRPTRLVTAFETFAVEFFKARSP